MVTKKENTFNKIEEANYINVNKINKYKYTQEDYI